jgi:allantoate deiminase
LPRAVLSDDVLAYLEFHIEQGPVLESLHCPLAAVEAIAGQTRMEVAFVGRANHAGTTPMNLRRDAMTAAAEWIIAVEHTAQKTPDLVATVGRVDATPGATNVIAGEVRTTLDLRHKSDDIRESTTDALIENARQIAERRGLCLRSRMLLNQPAVGMDSYLLAEIEEAIRMAGPHPHRMVSGAGHDAMILAEKVPAGMIFLRTPGGISHHPAESVDLADVEKAIACGLYLLERLAHSSHLHERMSRA